jgi:hypothetical protein
MRNLIAVITLLGCLHPAVAQVTAVPEQITPGSPFMLEISGIFPTPCSLDGREIETAFADGELMVTLVLDDLPCIEVLADLHRAFGAFRVDPELVPPGDSFIVSFNTIQGGISQPIVGQAEVSVVEAAPAVLPPISALYWDSELPGMGVSLEFQQQRAFLASYSYDESGQAVWFAGQGVLDGAVLETELMSTTGGPCLACQFPAATALSLQAESPLQLIIAGPAKALLATGDQPGRALILRPFAQAEVNSEGTIAGVTFTLPDLTGRWLFSNDAGEFTRVADIQLTPTGFSDSGMALFANADGSVQFSCGFSPVTTYQCQLLFDDVLVAEADATEISHNAIRSSSLVGVRLD